MCFFRSCLEGFSMPLAPFFHLFCLSLVAKKGHSFLLFQRHFSLPTKREEGSSLFPPPSSGVEGSSLYPLLSMREEGRSLSPLPLKRQEGRSLFPPPSRREEGSSLFPLPCSEREEGSPYSGRFSLLAPACCADRPHRGKSQSQTPRGAAVARRRRLR